MTYPINQSYHLDPARVACLTPRHTPINQSISLIQPVWCAPMASSPESIPSLAVVCTRCSWSQLSAYSNYRNLPLTSTKCLLLLNSMLWHRQAIFVSKGDKLSSSAEGRIRTHQGLRHQIASRLNARWQTDWAIEDQAKNLNSTARPYDQRAFSPLDPTAVWHSHLALAIYMFVVVNFDALAQASDIRIERRQVVFLCWRQDSNPYYRNLPLTSPKCQ